MAVAVGDGTRSLLILMGLRDSAWVWQCEGRGGGVGGVAVGRGPFDLLSLLKVITLWTVELWLLLLLGRESVVVAVDGLEPKIKNCCGRSAAGC